MNSAASLTLLRFSGVAAAELELECGLFLLWVPFDLLVLEEEEAAAGWGVRWEDDTEEDEEVEWDGRLCDDDDDDGFFFFLTGVGASYVRKDSKDMVGVSKSSSSSLGGESFGARGRPDNKEAKFKVNIKYRNVTLHYIAHAAAIFSSFSWALLTTASWNNQIINNFVFQLWSTILRAIRSESELKLWNCDF